MTARRGPMGERESAAALRSEIHHPVRTLAIILGDQLDPARPVLRGLNPRDDAVLMMEVATESSHVPSHVQRTSLFLSAMRHTALDLSDAGWRVRYVALDDPANTQNLSGEVARAVAAVRPRALRLLRPGEHRVSAAATHWGNAADVPIEITEDPHFLTSREQFAAWASGRRQLVLEYFYREQRRRLGVLLEPDGTPLGGVWNLDKENRLPFGKTGPNPKPRRPVRFLPDGVTREVVDLVGRWLPGNPGSAASFGWPVTPEQARVALDDFIDHRLPLFGPFEDAMWSDEPWLYHSTLAPALNLKLLDPRACIKAAEDALAAGRAPLQSVEGFVRQIIGWREFIRGVYELEGPEYAERNWLDQHGRLPDWYWTGDVDMRCLRDCIGGVVEHAYAHHIQRLMVMGNFALIAGVHPRLISEWYLAMYADAVDWVTLPNTLGMVMHADGTAQKPPVVGTKPYAASGQYIARMSNYCRSCRYDPAARTGDDACPFTVFYWDFLARHRMRLAKNPRMATIIKNLDRWGAEHLTQITVSAARLREKYGVGSISPGAPPPSYEGWDVRNLTSHSGASDLFECGEADVHPEVAAPNDRSNASQNSGHSPGGGSTTGRQELPTRSPRRRTRP